MTRLACGVYEWAGGVTVGSVPYLPDVDDEPVRAPAQPGARGEETVVAVADFPSGRFRGALWDARIETYTTRPRALGGNQLRVSVPASRRNMRILGRAVSGEVDQFGGQLYDLTNAVALELVVGSTVDGLARRRFVVRDQVALDGGRVTINAVGFVGGLTSDRVVGAPTRLNLIRTNPSFEQGTLAGWRARGGATAEVVSGGVDGSWCVRVKGPAGSWVERRVRYEQPTRPWGRQRIAGSARVKLPTSIDIEDFLLVAIAVVEGDEVVWPRRGQEDPGAARVTSDMVRGEWIDAPVEAIGYLPTPPYSADVYLRLYPTSATEWTFFDDGAIFRRENTSTVTATDLVNHPARLFAHAQRGRAKSTWGLGVVEGEATGISEVGTWWHEHGQSLDDALDVLGGQGLDVWDLAGPGRRVASSARQGRLRTDLRINEADVLGRFAWRLDPGAQRTAVRAVSPAGSLFGGADEGLIDTSRSFGQVIDVVMSAPVGMTPRELRRWLADQMASLATLQAGMGLLLRYSMGMRVETGDTVPVAARMIAAAHKDWMRITEWSPDRHHRFVAVVLGTDTEGAP